MLYIMLIFEAIILLLIYLRILLMAKYEPKIHKKNEKMKNKSNSLMALILFESIVLSILSIPNNWLKLGFLQISILVNITGISLMAIGIYIRYISIKTLGKYYSTKLNTKNDHTLVKQGIYKYLRHPIYLGDLTLYIGIGIGLSNYICFFVLSVTSIIAYISRIKQEENMLISFFGKEYLEYKKTSYRLIPYIY
jgi:protein-S-isoprenylcysteine O-methyltransferase Ste14